MVRELLVLILFVAVPILGAQSLNIDLDRTDIIGANPPQARLSRNTMRASLAQIFSPIPSTMRVYYEVQSSADLSANLTLYVNESNTPYATSNTQCGTDLKCIATPVAEFFTAVNAAGFPKNITASLRNSEGESARSLPATVEGQQEPPPPVTGCNYVSPQGVQSVRPIGDNTIHGYNPMDLNPQTNPNAVAARQAHADRMKLLRSWGFRIDSEQYVPSEHRMLIFTTCVGLP